MDFKVGMTVVYDDSNHRVVGKIKELREMDKYRYLIEVQESDVSGMAEMLVHKDNEKYLKRRILAVSENE